MKTYPGVMWATITNLGTFVYADLSINEYIKTDRKAKYTYRYCKLICKT